MNYKHVEKDFAMRTKKNLEIIRNYEREHPGDAYDVTQLVNSLLGLLIFPKERFYNQIPETSIEDLRKTGWPIPNPTLNYKQVANLKVFMRYFRNAVAHFNIEFLADNTTQQLCGLKVWNTTGVGSSRVKNWEVKLSLVDIEIITDKFIDLIIS